jgi:hypothetical protein
MDGKEVPNDRQAFSGQQKPEVKFHCLTHADISGMTTLFVLIPYDPWRWEGPWSTGEPGAKPANPGTRTPCLGKRILGIGPERAPNTCGARGRRDADRRRLACSFTRQC